MSSQDEFRKQFKAVANCDDSTAIDCLIRTEWDIDRAIGLYFDEGRDPNFLQISGRNETYETGRLPIAVANENDENQRLKRLAEETLRTTTNSIEIQIEFVPNGSTLTFEIDQNRTLTEIRRFLREHFHRFHNDQFNFFSSNQTEISRDAEQRTTVESKIFVSSS